MFHYKTNYMLLLINFLKLARIGFNLRPTLDFPRIFKIQFRNGATKKPGTIAITIKPLYNHFKQPFNITVYMPETPQELTFNRLLQAAVEVFAEYGFRDATVREICTRANVNVASVNYYFRSKEALYGQALAFAFTEMNRRYPYQAAQDKSLPPEQRLTLFISHFVHKLLDDSHFGIAGKLISREIAEPTKALDIIIDQAIVPQCTLLEEIIGQLLGGRADKLALQRCVLSVLGQCLMFKHSRSIIDRLFPEAIAGQTAIQASAEHIAAFSLAAISHLKPTTAGAL